MRDEAQQGNVNCETDAWTDTGTVIQSCHDRRCAGSREVARGVSLVLEGRIVFVAENVPEECVCRSGTGGRNIICDSRRDKEQVVAGGRSGIRILYTGGMCCLMALWLR